MNVREIKALIRYTIQVKKTELNNIKKKLENPSGWNTGSLIWEKEKLEEVIGTLEDIYKKTKKKGVIENA